MKLLLSFICVKLICGQKCQDQGLKKECEDQVRENLTKCLAGCDYLDFTCRRNCNRQFSKDIDGNLSFIHIIFVVFPH